MPDFSGGLNTMIKYKSFSLYALFTIQWGGHARLPELYTGATSTQPGLPRPEQNVSRKCVIVGKSQVTSNLQTYLLYREPVMRQSCYRRQLLLLRYRLIYTTCIIIGCPSGKYGFYSLSFYLPCLRI